MNRAVILNNQGVALLQQSNFTDAIQTLNDSLRLIDCAVECSKNQNNNEQAARQQAENAAQQNNNNNTADMMTRKTVCILRMEEPVGGGRRGSSNAAQEGVTIGDVDHFVTAGTRPVSVVPLSDEASEVMDVELVTSVIFFNISLSYATRAHAHQQQQANMRGDHQMAMRLSETGWSILSGRLALAMNSDNFHDQNDGGCAAEPYLCMAEKILHQLIELHEEQQLGTDAEEQSSSSASSSTILCTYYDLLECVLHSLTMVESMQDMEKQAAAGAA